MKQRVVNPWTWQDDFGFVQANEVSSVKRVLICSGQASMDAKGMPAYVGDMRGQLGQALDNLEQLLRTSGFELRNVVRLNYYTTDVDRLFEAYELAVTRLRDAGCRPASTLLGVARLAEPELLIEIEATAMA